MRRTVRFIQGGWPPINTNGLELSDLTPFNAAPDASRAPHRTEWSPLLPYLLPVLILVARIGPWLLSDFWYDEVVTLVDFAIGPPRADTILHVFRSYPVANNHVLYSAVLWCWVRLINFRLDEALLRLPSVVFAVLTLVCVVRLWTRWIGQRLAVLVAVAFAVSPVLASFSYQLRGYSLTLLLCTLAVAGVLDVADGQRRSGTALLAGTAFLLPLVIPANVLVVAGHVCFLLWQLRNRPLRERCASVGAVVLAGAGGCAYYLTIWPQFVAAAKQTVGWSSRWLVLGNLALGFAAHAGAFAALIGAGVLLRRNAGPTSAGTPDPASDIRHPASSIRHSPSGQSPAIPLLLSSLAPVVLAILVLPSAPFPRVFLCFFPTWTMALALAWRQQRVWWRPSLAALCGIVVFHGFVWEAVAARHAQRRVAAGEHPQSLVQHYYKNQTGCSDICAFVRGHSELQQLSVLVTAHDFPSVRFYWSLAGMPGEHVLAENTLDQLSADAAARLACRPFAAVAQSPTVAARLFGGLGRYEPFVPVHQADSRALYVRAADMGKTGWRR